MFEVGCGVGNCLFLFLEEDSNIFVYVCDFFLRVVEYVKVGVLFMYFVIFLFFWICLICFFYLFVSFYFFF